jgi:preprotein translocase subunit SecG
LRFIIFFSREHQCHLLRRKDGIKMFGFITALHVIICIALIMIVLLQTGKGAEMGAAFGGSTQTVFGSSGPAGFLNKLTTAVAILFMITSLTLCYLTGRLPIPTIMEEKTVEQAGGEAQNVEGLPVAEMPQQVEQMPAAPVAEQGEPMQESLPE